MSTMVMGDVRGGFPLGGFPPSAIPVGDLRDEADRLRAELVNLEAASSKANVVRDKAAADLAAIEGRQAAAAAALVELAPLLTEARRAAVAGEDRTAELASLNARRHALGAEREELAEQLTVAKLALSDASGAATLASNELAGAGLLLEATEIAVLAGESDAKFDVALGQVFATFAERDDLDLRAVAVAKAIADHNAAARRDGRPLVSPLFPEPVTLDLRRIPAASRPHRPLAL